MNLIQQRGSLEHMLDAQQIFPGIAAYPEEVRTRFARSLVLYQDWLSAEGQARREAASRAAVEMHTSRTAVERLFRHLVKAQDFALLLPRPRADKGKSRAWDDAALEYLKARYTHFHSKLRAYEDTVDTCGELGLRVGSYRSACHHIAEWKDDPETKAMLAMQHKWKDYSDEYEIPILRDTTDLRPMEIICGDHHQFDAVVLWSDGTIVRPWVSAWIDVRTRRWLGLTVCKSPDSRSIADSLYWTIKKLGIPENIYIDNGKAYRARILKGVRFTEDEVGRIDLSSDASAMLDALQKGLYGNSRRVHALPFNARAKVVERYFGIGGFSDWCKTLPGWTGRRYDDMPDDTRKRIKSRKLLTLDEFLLRLLDEVKRMNNRPSRAHGMGNSSPNDVLAWYIANGWRPHMPSNDRLIDLMAMHQTTRRVRAYGLQIASKTDDPMYYYAETLRRHIGRDVIVKWSAADMMARKVFTTENEEGYYYRAVPSVVLVYTEKGEFVCEAEPVQRTAYLDDPDVGKNMKARNARRKELRSKMKDITEYVQLPPSASGDGDEVIETKPLKAKSVGGISEIEQEIRASRRKKGRFRDRLDQSNTTEDDEEVVL